MKVLPLLAKTCIYLVLLFRLTACEKKQETKRPNVVVILTDDQRWDALSFAGNPPENPQY